MRINQGAGLAADITRKHAKTFFFCSLFLEKKKRIAAYSVYAFSRMIDDSFDAGGPAGYSELKKWSETILKVYGNSYMDDPVLISLRNTVKEYSIPIEYFQELIKGMEMDISIKEYSDFDQLYKYCYRVAGVIGLIMIRIFGHSNEEALLYAEKMGIAMQLTNILRDIKEDLGMGRIYLPHQEIEEYNVDPENIRKGIVDNSFRSFMQFQIERARSYYDSAYPGLKLITDKNSRFIARLMGVLYSGILDSIQANGYDVFSKRIFVPLNRKIILLLKTLNSR